MKMSQGKMPPSRRPGQEPMVISVDVAVPCYHYGHYLRDCTASILEHGMDDLRILIIDNASTDDSLSIARQIATEDRRVQVSAHARNLGQHASFNEAVDWCRADYFLLLCADDLLAPGALQRACSIMERCPTVNLTYGRALSIGAEEPVPDLSRASDAGWRILAGSALLERFCRSGRCHVPGPTAVVRTVAQKRAGHYRPELVHCDDF